MVLPPLSFREVSVALPGMTYARAMPSAAGSINFCRQYLSNSGGIKYGILLLIGYLTCIQ
jgi:hypothetical protein